MNVTREVVTDLLPVYFAGEASGDTKVLVEDYFRENPDFERVARSAATPLETLRGTAPLRPDAEKEKRDLENVCCELQRRKWLFGLGLFFTLVPLFVFTNGHIVSTMMVRNNPWGAALDWGFAALMWFLYFARVRRRTASMVGAIFFTLIPLPIALHIVFAGGPRLNDNLLVPAIIWIGAVFCWVGYFRARARC